MCVRERGWERGREGKRGSSAPVQQRMCSSTGRGKCPNMRAGLGCVSPRGFHSCNRVCMHVVCMLVGVAFWLQFCLNRTERSGAVRSQVSSQNLEHAKILSCLGDASGLTLPSPNDVMPGLPKKHPPLVHVQWSKSQLLIFLYVLDPAARVMTVLCRLSLHYVSRERLARPPMTK